MTWIAYFPGDDRGVIHDVHGPFFSEDEARAFARTLSTDPDEGEITRIHPPELHRQWQATNTPEIRAREAQALKVTHR